MNDNNTELLQALSNININSETAVEVVELYCQYQFYLAILNAFSLIGFIAIIALFGWYVVKAIKEVDSL